MTYFDVVQSQQDGKEVLTKEGKPVVVHFISSNGFMALVTGRGGSPQDGEWVSISGLRAP